MKKIKVLSIVVFMIVTILVMQERSYAGLTVTKSGSFKDKITYSAAFAYCYNLRVSNSTLGENKLDPHLMLNSDVAAALYLATSSYGMGKGEFTQGPDSYINGNSSGIAAGYEDITSAMMEGYENSQYKEIYLSNLVNFADTKYVEILPQDINAESNKGKAFSEISRWGTISWYSYPSNSNQIAIKRFKLQYYKSVGVSGGGDSGVYFRPVIWN